jgi:transposase
MGHYVGIDVHRKYSQVCVLDQEGRQLSQQRLHHEDEQLVVEFFAQLPAGTPVALEAGAGWMWLADLLEGLGHQVHLAHPSGVSLIAQSRLKTDKVDARALAQLLRTGFLPEAYLAPQQLREKRMVLRHREGLLKWRTMAKNRVHALLRRHNHHLPVSDAFGVAGTRMLKELQLPRPVRLVLDRLLESIEFFNQKIQQSRDQLSGMLEPDQRVEWLSSTPGIGKLTAYYLVAEIGQIGRFPSPCKLASYAGLCPSTRQSGNKLWRGRTGPAGRRLIKWVLVEAAHTAVRRDSYFAQVFHRIERSKCKQKAYVAVARKMACIIWQMLSEGRPYQHRTKETQVGSVEAMAVRSKVAPTP